MTHQAKGHDAKSRNLQDIVKTSEYHTLLFIFLQNQLHFFMQGVILLKFFELELEIRNVKYRIINTVNKRL